MEDVQGVLVSVTAEPACAFMKAHEFISISFFGTAVEYS